MVGEVDIHVLNLCCFCDVCVFLTTTVVCDCSV